jgi:hypothetical protein
MLEQIIFWSFTTVFNRLDLFINSLSYSIKLFGQKLVFTTIVGGGEDDRGSGRITTAMNIALLY